MTWMSAVCPPSSLPLEILIDLDDEHRPAVVDEGLDVLCPSEVRHAMEDAGPVEPRQQLLRSGRSILIEHGIRHVIQVVTGRVAEDQALHDRRNEDAEAAARVLERREQLFARQGEDAEDCVEHTTISFSSAG